MKKLVVTFIILYFVSFLLIGAIRSLYEDIDARNTRNAYVICDAINRAFFLGTNNNIPGNQYPPNQTLDISHCKDEACILQYKTVYNYKHYTIAGQGSAPSRGEDLFRLITKILFGPFRWFFGEHDTQYVCIVHNVYMNTYAQDKIIDAINNPCFYVYRNDKINMDADNDHTHQCLEGVNPLADIVFETRNTSDGEWIRGVDGEMITDLFQE